MRRDLDLRLYLVTDRALCGARGPAAVAAAAVAGGATLVQIREKTAPARDFVAMVRAVQAALAGTGVPVIVNDRIDIALACGADGVHVGQDDIDPADARRLIGPRAILGLSVATASEAAGADGAIVDYLGAGPVHPTGTKITETLVSAAEWQRLRAATTLPIVAIGGLDAGNAGAIMAAGADGIAVVSALCAAADPAQAARTLRSVVDHGLAQRR